MEESTIECLELKNKQVDSVGIDQAEDTNL